MSAIDVEVQVGTAPLVDVDVQFGDAPTIDVAVQIAPPTFTVMSVLPTGPRGPAGPAGADGPGGSSTQDVTQVAHGLAVGDVLRFDGVDYVEAQADSAVNAEVVGMVSAVADADNFTLALGGRVDGLSGLTAGSVFFLDAAVAGVLTDVEPSSVGEVSKPLLIADSTTSGYLFNFRGAIVPAPGATGTPILRSIEFEFDAPGLSTGWDTGLTLPVGTQILNIWFRITEAWDGITPLGDVGTFQRNPPGHGWFSDTITTVDMTQADGDIEDDDGLAIGLGGNDWIHMSVIQAASLCLEADPDTGVISVDMHRLRVGTDRYVPAEVTAEHPLLIVVSQDGTNATPVAAVFTTETTATVPLTVTADVNDQFAFDNGAGSVQFTVAPGTYGTVAALAAAMGAALDTDTGTVALSTLVTPSDNGGTLKFTALTPGAGGNCPGIGSGTNDLIASGTGLVPGFPPANALTGGAGGDPGATQGRAEFYILTAEPIEL